MAGSLNQVTLIGYLGAEPEVRTLSSGDLVANLRIATQEAWKDKANGEQREKTEWHRVVIFNKGLAQVAEKYLRKGSLCMVQGKLQTRKWTDQQGHDRYSTEVVLQGFEARLAMLGGGPRERQEGEESHEARAKPAGAAKSDTDSEIPF